MIVIVDGAYYTEKKMKQLKSLMRNDELRSFALHIEEIPNVLDKLRNE